MFIVILTVECVCVCESCLRIVVIASTMVELGDVSLRRPKELKLIF